MLLGGLFYLISSMYKVVQKNTNTFVLQKIFIIKLILLDEIRRKKLNSHGIAKLISKINFQL